jgi:hypothetical protein
VLSNGIDLVSSPPGEIIYIPAPGFSISPSNLPVTLAPKPAGGPAVEVTCSETKMDLTRILTEMHLEREHLEEVILSLERLAAGGARRRGRPPAWMAKSREDAVEKRRPGRPPGSKNMKAAE